MQWLLGIRSHKYDELRLECLEACAKYFYRNADRKNLLVAVNQFERLAAVSNDNKWLRKAQSYLGIAYADAGDTYRSLVCYGRALRIARAMGDQHDQAVVLLNMGTALMTAGLYTDSMRAFQRAYEIGMSDVSLLRYACSSASNMAQVSCYQGRPEAGIAHLHAALRLDAGFPAEQYDLHRVVLEQVYVQLSVALGDSHLAAAHLRECEAMALRAQSSRATLVAKLARSLYEIEFGDASVGESLLRSAAPSLAPNSSEWVDCQLFLMRALEKMGRANEALSCADLLARGLAELSESGVRALAEEHQLPDLCYRADGLDMLGLERSRLEAKVARAEAARARWETVERLAMTSELKADPGGMHGHRVGKLASALARHLRLSPDAVARIAVAGRLHDIGKIAMPEKLLHAATLSAAQRSVLNAHASIGADLLGGSAIPEVQCAEIVARHHHERWDGQGYPSKLAGSRIPIECRIVAIADSFDAMTRGRPHARPLSTDVALAEIRLQAGKQFDPDIAEAFEPLVREMAGNNPSITAYLESDVKVSPLAKAVAELNDLLAEIGRVPGRAPHPGDASEDATSKRYPEPL